MRSGWLTATAAITMMQIATAPASGPLQVDVALVLAVDVSRSMDPEELAIQRAGYVDALQHPDFISAVRDGRHGRIALLYFEWASAPIVGSRIGWTVIDGDASASEFAEQVRLRPFGTYHSTSISAALDFAAEELRGLPVQSNKRVIDISGDGFNNVGRLVIHSRNAVLNQGIVINGLPIMISEDRSDDQLDSYFAACVAGGPGSFVLPINKPSEFATGIRRKLILEVSQREPPAAVVKVQAKVEIQSCVSMERALRQHEHPSILE